MCDLLGEFYKPSLDLVFLRVNFLLLHLLVEFLDNYLVLRCRAGRLFFGPLRPLLRVKRPKKQPPRPAPEDEVAIQKFDE